MSGYNYNNSYNHGYPNSHAYNTPQQNWNPPNHNNYYQQTPTGMPINQHQNLIHEKMTHLGGRNRSRSSSSSSSKGKRQRPNIAGNQYQQAQNAFRNQQNQPYNGQPQGQGIINNIRGKVNEFMHHWSKNTYYILIYKF